MNNEIIQLSITQVAKIYQNPNEFIKINDNIHLKFVKEKEGKLLYYKDNPYNCDVERENTLTVLCKENQKEYDLFILEGGEDKDDLQILNNPNFTL
jgi:sRNA-binding carbon storage regulator CsrA